MWNEMECLTLVLAAGRGKGLSPITQDRAKALVSFGGAYRLLDFVLGNSLRSGIGRIGMLTQYGQSGVAGYVDPMPARYTTLGETQIDLLPPRIVSGAKAYYTGDADAIWKNADYIQKHTPRYLLILTGEHIYTMEYGKVVQAHRDSGAAATIAVTPAPYRRSPYGAAVRVDGDGRVIGLGSEPQGNAVRLVPMGVAVFTWAALRRHLLWDSTDSHSGTDMEMDVLPDMLGMGEDVAAYLYDGYWREISSVHGLWEANMELLSALQGAGALGAPCIGKHENTVFVRHYLSDNSQIRNALVAKGSKINGTISNSVVSAGAYIAKDAHIARSVVMPGARVGKGALIRNAILNEGAVVEDGAVIDGASLDSVHTAISRGVAIYAPDMAAGASVPGKAG
ncbi:MAG: sugar phosphate nucleotidyltransferase [Clostridiales bacterium]|nr:sugar phosphate nucleotidyltransferase [Clostridiales bacterium]